MKLADMQTFQRKSQKSGIYDKYQNRFVVCINTQGRLILSKTVIEAIGNPTHVQFRTDGKNVIVICPSDAHDTNGYTLLKAGGKSTSESSKYRIVSAYSLLKSMDYKIPEYPIAYNVEYKGGVIWLSLGDPASRA